jgi:hypothetical protein
MHLHKPAIPVPVEHRSFTGTSSCQHDEQGQHDEQAINTEEQAMTKVWMAQSALSVLIRPYVFFEPNLLLDM